MGADGSYRRWTDDVHRQGGRRLTVKSVLWTVIETETPTQGQKHDGEAGWASSAVFQSSAFYFSEELAFLYLKYRIEKMLCRNFFPPKIVKGASPKFEYQNKVYFCHR